MRGALLLLALIAAAASLSASQASQPGPAVPGQPTGGQRTPPRDPSGRPSEQPTGTAVMRGQIRSTDGTPLRRALVRAIAADGRGGGSVSTDGQGRFEIKDLPAGRFTVSASKAGYVTMQFGQRNAQQSGSGTILDVLDKQIVEKIAITLPRGGVVTGRLLDDFGEPIAGAQVSAQRYRFMQGGRRLTPFASDTSDDQGNFRIYGLPPGEYVVSGIVRGQQMMAMPGMTAAEESYAPSYYPGTPNAAEAQRITVRGGQELSEINFALSAARLARVRGRVTTSGGDAPAAQMMVMASPREQFAMGMMMASAMTRPDGTFQLVNLAPGTYTVTARAMTNPGTRPEVAQTIVTVGNGEDVDNLLLALSHGAIARGTIVTDEGTPLPLVAQSVRLFATAATPGLEIGPITPIVNNDGTFEISGLFDRRTLRAGLSHPGDWFLKAIYHRGEDVTDMAIEFTPGQTLEGFQVVFTRKTTEITGVARDDKGQPVLDATIVVFPNDPSLWTTASRFVRTARLDQEGRFRLRNLPPHDDYRLVAVRDLEEGRWMDPEFLERAREFASRVSLLEGQTALQDLKVQAAP